MRKELGQLDRDKAYTFTGRFEKYGSYIKKSYRKGKAKSIEHTSMLLKNIKLNGEKFVTDHAWIDIPSNLHFNYKQGDTVQFTAFINSYIKGYWGDKHGYGNKKLELDFQFENAHFNTKEKKLYETV